ncbi:uncharacterized protein L201_000822 [Kwoniella dendrophila CBS 6074]|uniref:Velvet domain-containing protein n=1 Tax=Kwoniella dendrophila CBS 6074 TaxID=1295534 RepID=A0AAX4JKM2_9TREE
MYPPPPPQPTGRTTNSSSSHHVSSSSGSGSGSGSASGSSTSNLTTTTALGHRMLPNAPSPKVLSHDHATDPDPLNSAIAPTTEDIDWVFTPPVLVKHGMFEGRSLRFALAVAQEPVLGRRKTEKDRRPLGPAPIVRFRAVERKRRQSGGSGTGSEEEIDPSSIEPSHLICAAELGLPQEKSRHANSSQPHASQSNINTNRKQQPSTPDGESDPISIKIYDDGKTIHDVDDEDIPMIDGGGERLEIMRSSPPTRDGFGHDHGRSSSSASRLNDIISSERESNVRSGSTSGTATPQQDIQMGADGDNDMEIEFDGEDPIPVVHEDVIQQAHRNAPANESTGGQQNATITASKGVRNLYGNLHVAGVRVPAPEGGMGTWFLFTDLSVRQEGTYSLRFRCFDLTAIATDAGAPAPCLVEAQSQPFRVYSPRQVPPLPKPTDLAEHFAKQGFKLNTRKNERTASSPPPILPPPPPPPTFSSSSSPNTTRTKRSDNSISAEGEKRKEGIERERPDATPIQGSDSDNNSGERDSIGIMKKGGEGGSSTSSSMTTVYTAESGSFSNSGGSYQSMEEMNKKKK